MPGPEYKSLVAAVTPDVRKQFQKEAKRADVTVSALLRAVLQDFLRKNQTERKKVWTKYEDLAWGELLKGK